MTGTSAATTPNCENILGDLFSDARMSWCTVPGGTVYCCISGYTQS